MPSFLTFAVGEERVRLCLLIIITGCASSLVKSCNLPHWRLACANCSVCVIHEILKTMYDIFMTNYFMCMCVY